MSPWVSTTRLSLVATITPHPVPQNRQGALFHCSSLDARSVIKFAPSAGEAMPPAAAAIAAASSFRIWRRSSFLVMFLPCTSGVDRVENKRGREYVGQQRDGVERRPDRTGIRCLDDHH